MTSYHRLTQGERASISLDAAALSENNTISTEHATQ